MEEYQIVGYCPKCGCPIYQPVLWAGNGPATVEYVCKCYNQTEPSVIEEINA